MRSLLVINPNTTDSVTALLRDHVQAALGPQVQVRAVTAPFGAPYIADEASYVVGAHAALQAWKDACEAHEAPDATLVGCFGDPGVFALREAGTAPVLGLAEAAFIEAARLGRFAIVTGGAKWAPMLRRLAASVPTGAQLAGIHTLAPTGAELAADPLGARRLVAQACRAASRQWGTASVIVGGAALAGMAADVQAQVDVPLIDSVAAGARQCREAMRG